MGPEKNGEAKVEDRVRALYRVLVTEGGVPTGRAIPVKTWRKVLYRAFGITSASSQHRYTELMELNGLLRKAWGIVVLVPPHEVEDPLATASTEAEPTTARATGAPTTPA